MLVINKKRIKIMLTCIFLGLFAFSVNLGNPFEGDAVLMTSSSPSSGKTVVLDARSWSTRWRSTKQQWNSRIRN